MTAFSGFHFQRPVNDWPRAAAILPAGTWIKFIDNVQALDEAKRVNPSVKTVLRHFDGGWQQFDFANHAERRAHARAFLLSFVDGTFMNYAHNVDAIEELNEYNSASHTSTDVAKRVEWVRAVSEEWAAIKSSDPRLSHIRLVVGNVPIGNDLPLEAARIVQQYGNIAGYHPYTPTKQGQVRPDEWRWYSGRWTQMDARYREAGITVEWLFTEAGPIGYTGDHLGPNDGWRHSDVCNGNVDQLLAVCKYWMDKTAQWNATHGGRAMGQVLYNSGGANNEWKLFEIAQPEMDRIATFNRDYEPPVVTPPPPPPPPDPDPRRYVKKAHVVAPTIRRRLFDAVIDEAWQNKESVFFSIDDAMQPAANDGLVTVTSRTVTVWNVEQVLSRPEEEAKAALEEFASVYYPEPDTVFNYRRLGRLFVADEWAPPIGTAAERASGAIWPGGWIDATPFATRYQLGSSFYYHPGCDLNLNTPTFDMDRNKPVYAAASGKIVYAGVPSTAWQGVVVMRHTSADGKTVYTRYAHLQPDEIVVQAEDWLKVGELIGLTGRNMVGSTPGPYHLHFEVGVSSKLLKDPGYWPPPDDLATVLNHWTDPKAWLRARV